MREVIARVRDRKEWRSYVPILFVVIAVIAVGVATEKQHHIIEMQNERERVRTQLETLDAQLESNLNQQIQAAHGIVAALATEPDMTLTRFNLLTSHMISQSSGIQNVAGARNMVVNLVAPFKSKETLLGLNYNTNEALSEAAQHVRDAGEFSLVGPVETTQGDQAFIGLFPVFSEIGGSHEFWGVLSVAIDVPSLYQNAGLLNLDHGLELALAGRDDKGIQGEQYLGPAELLADNPVFTEVNFPNGSWQLSARPLAGWGSTTSSAVFRSLLLAVAIAVISLATMTSVLFVQRQRTIRTLKRREQDLETARRDLETLALHDHLTGLPNRRYLDLELQKLAGKGHPGLILLDLDGFKEVNDTYGHAFGDHLLIEISKRLEEVMQPGTFLARSGGDEFVAICKSIGRDQPSWREVRDYLENTAKSFINCAQHPFLKGQQKCRVGLSVGIHQVAADSRSAPEDWLTQADHAMYRAKKSGRNRYAFSSSIPYRSNTRVHRSDELLEALGNGQIQPFYQPQFGVDCTSVVGVEALARWIHPNGGVVHPKDFMDQAYELKIEGEIDQLIFSQAVRDLAHWDKLGLHVPQVAVNVSFRRLGDPQLMDAVDFVSADPKRFAFELLESIFLDNENNTLSRNVKALKSRGFSVGVDDFGTGHSSVVSLLKLRPHCLKIDKGLVQAAPTSRENRRLLATIAEMGHAMNIIVCAEGIETQEQLLTARAVGCTRFQGYLLARPMSMLNLQRYLRSAKLSKGADIVAI